MAVKYAMCKNCGNTKVGDKIYRCPRCHQMSCFNCTDCNDGWSWGKCPHCGFDDHMTSSENEIGEIGIF